MKHILLFDCHLQLDRRYMYGLNIGSLSIHQRNRLIADRSTSDSDIPIHRYAFRIAQDTTDNLTNINKL